MVLMVCTDCGGRVSSSADQCVHCGNVLQAGHPGAIGTAVRIVYYGFCGIVIFVGGISLIWALRSGNIGAAASTIAISLAVWFFGSISAVVLLYVTRAERRLPVSGATRSAVAPAPSNPGTVAPPIDPDAAWRLHSGR